MVICTPPSQINQASLVDHLMQFVDSGIINKWAIPKKFLFVEGIPKTSVGKVNKKLIRENELAHQELTSVDV
jgi:fatty-acyl-CoA synthase